MAMFGNVFNDLNTAITKNIEVTGTAEMQSDTGSANIITDILNALTKAWQTNMSWVNGEPGTSGGAFTPGASAATLAQWLKDLGANLSSGQPTVSLAAVNALMLGIAQCDSGVDAQTKSTDTSLAQSYYSQVNSQSQMETTQDDTTSKAVTQQISQDQSNMTPFTDMVSTAIGNGIEQAAGGFLQQTF